MCSRCVRTVAGEMKSRLLAVTAPAPAARPRSTRNATWVTGTDRLRTPAPRAYSTCLRQKARKVPMTGTITAIL